MPFGVTGRNMKPRGGDEPPLSFSRGCAQPFDAVTHSACDVSRQERIHATQTDAEASSESVFSAQNQHKTASVIWLGSCRADRWIRKLLVARLTARSEGQRHQAGACWRHRIRGSRQGA